MFKIKKTKAKRGIMVLENKLNITDQVEQQPRGGIIYVEGLEVEDNEASGGDSGFVPDVEGWGDYHDIEMPLS